MKFDFIKYYVQTELDFVEDGVEKIDTKLTVYFKVSTTDDPHNILPILTKELTVINLNTQTGIEMDQQREDECIQYINSLS